MTRKEFRDRLCEELEGLFKCGLTAEVISDAIWFASGEDADKAEEALTRALVEWDC